MFEILELGPELKQWLCDARLDRYRFPGPASAAGKQSRFEKALLEFVAEPADFVDLETDEVSTKLSNAAPLYVDYVFTLLPLCYRTDQAIA